MSGLPHPHSNTPQDPRTSSPPRSATLPPARARRRRAARLDEFHDDPLHRLARVPKRTLPIPSASLGIGVAGATCAALQALTTLPAPGVGVLAASVVAGAVLARDRLTRVAPFLAGCAAAGAGIAAWRNGVSPVWLSSTSAALFAAGFSLLGRAVLSGAVHATRRAEQARRDGELLGILEDARLFRLLGRSDALDDETAATRRALGQGLAVRDGLYRLLRLGERALHCDALALYAIDGSGKALRLVEQLLAVDGENVARLPLGGRGVGAAGAAGMVVARRATLRLLDVDGAGVRAHRPGAPVHAVMAVPLLEQGVVRGVLVVDRERADAFTDADEAFALTLADEMLAMMRTERLLEELDGERKKSARVFSATRAFAGVVRTADTIDAAIGAVLDVLPRAGVAVVEVDRDSDALRVVRAVGACAPLLGCEAVRDDESWVGRALQRHEVLPHVPLAVAGHRRLLDATTNDAIELGALGDLRVLPLQARGDTHGALVVTLPTGEKLGTATLDALGAIADVFAVTWSGARAFDVVEKQATTDGLTGLSNRRTLDRRLDEALARATRNKTTVSVILTDVDHFKSVNDAWGHATGDDVLKGVARALAQQARETDVVARYGGEEFCMVLEGTDGAGAARLAERMRLAVKGLRFHTAKGPLQVTSSFGVVVWQPGETGHDVVERADQQLYRAKQQGRDRVVLGGGPTLSLVPSP